MNVCHLTGWVEYDKPQKTCQVTEVPLVDSSVTYVLFGLASFKRVGFEWTLSQYQALNRNSDSDEIHTLLEDLVSYPSGPI